MATRHVFGDFELRFINDTLGWRFGRQDGQPIQLPPDDAFKQDFVRSFEQAGPQSLKLPKCRDFVHEHDECSAMLRIPPTPSNDGMNKYIRALVATCEALMGMSEQTEAAA